MVFEFFLAMLLYLFMFLSGIAVDVPTIFSKLPLNLYPE